MAAGSGGVPPGAGGTPPGSGGGGGNLSPDILNGTKDAASDAAKSIGDSNAMMAKAFEMLGANVETTSKKILRFRDDVKGIILFTDDAAEAIKGFSDKTKELAKNLLQDKSYAHTKDSMTKMVSLLKEMRNRTKENSKEYSGMTAQIDRMRAAQDKLGATTEKAFNESEDAVDEYAKSLNEAGKAMARLAAESTKLKGLTGLGRMVGGVRQNLIEAGVMKAGRFEKYAAMGNAGEKLKEAAKSKREGKQAEFVVKRDAARSALENLEKAGGIKLPRNASGGINWGAAAADRKKFAGTGAGAGQALADLQAANAAPKGGLMGKLTGGGAVEGAVGKVAEVAGKFALPLSIGEAIVQAIRFAIDKNAEMNKQAEQLSGGGLIAGAGGPGGKSAQETFLAARSNLMPAGGFSQLGLNYDRSIKMAQAVIESGYGVEEIGQGSQYGAKKGDFAPGTFGEVQKMAATTGRVTGMGDAASMQMGMKLLTQYRQSMEGMDTFMVNLNKDFRMAGLSVAKYVSILEEVTGQFDRMNKSIDQTSGVLRALSRTGRQTAEDLAEEMKNIVGDPKRDTGMRIYLDQQMKNTGQARENVAMQEGVRAKEAANAYNALGERGIGLQLDGKPITPAAVTKLLSSPEGRQQLNTMMTSLQAQNPNIDARRFITAQGAVTKAGQETDRATLMKQFADGAIDANTYDARIEALGKSPTTQANENLSAAKTVMQMPGRDVSALSTNVSTITKPKTQSLLEFFKLSPTLLRDTQTELENQGQSRLKLGMTNEKYGEGLFNMYKSQMGPEGTLKTDATTGKQETFGEALARWSKDPRYGRAFMNTLRGGNKMMEKLYDTNSDMAAVEDDDAKSAEKARIDDAAKSAGRATQTTADIFATAFSYYFTELINILDSIRNFFAHSKYFGGIKPEQEIAGADIVKKSMTLLDQAAADTDLKIAGIQKELNTVGDDATKRADLEAKLKVEQTNKAALETRTKYGPNSGYTDDQANGLLQLAAHAIQNGQGDITQALKDMGDQFDEAGVATLTPDQYAQQKQMLAATGTLGLVKPSTNLDAKGNPTSYTINITNYSHETTQQVSTLNDTRAASDKAKQVKAAEASTAGLSASCWIAAAIYGGWDAPEVPIIRNFIFNDWAKRSTLGALVAKAYMAYGERVAKYVTKSPLLKKIFKSLFDRML